MAILFSLMFLGELHIMFTELLRGGGFYMTYHLPECVMRDITSFASRHAVEKVILFGSRARGTHTERSDIDLAVYGGDFDSFYFDIQENAHTLLRFDMVDAGNPADGISIWIYQ